jgi:hypothetical protein
VVTSQGGELNPLVSVRPPLPSKYSEGGFEMTIELIEKTAIPNLVCHFCGLAKPPHETVKRGHFRLCRECLLKHQVDIVVMGTEAIEEPLAKE